MIRTIILNRNLINFGLPLGLLAILAFIIKSSFINGNDTLNLAITIDLLITVPLVYFLLIRKTQIPKTTVVPIMIAGLLIGTYLLPQESQAYLKLFKNWALLVIELTILFFLIIKVRKAIITIKNLKIGTPDFYDTLKTVCQEILPNKLVRPFSTEVAVFYYGFINWKTKKIGENEFTYHKRSGTPALMGGLIMIITIETIGLHFILAHWNALIAWILTGLSIYTALQIFGFARALSKRPIALEDNKLLLRYGIMNEAQIPISNIESVLISKKRLGKDKFTTTLSPFGELESQNLVINLKVKSTLFGLYGIKKNFKVIGVQIDEPHLFKEQIDGLLQEVE